MSERPGLVLDASACINFLGSGVIHQILAALARPVTVVSPAAREVLRDPFRFGKPGAPLSPCVEARLLAIAEMDATVLQTFVDLTAAPPPDDLDDGEAATIAYASHRKLVAVVDERKGLRIAGSAFPGLVVATSVDIFREERVLAALGRDRLAEAVYSACTTARMRIPRDDQDWVRDLVGTDRAAKCPTLNGGGRRFPPDPRALDAL